MHLDSVDSSDYAFRINWEKLITCFIATALAGLTLVIPALSTSGWWCFAYALTTIVAAFITWIAWDDLRDLDVLAERSDIITRVWVMIAVALSGVYAMIAPLLAVPAIPWPIGAVLTLAFSIWFWRDTY